MTEAVFLGVFVQHLNQIHHGEKVDVVALGDGGHSQGDGQVGLAHARWPQEQDVLTVGQEAHGGQLPHLTLVDGRLEGEVELVQGLDEGEMGQSGLHGHIPLIACRGFQVQQPIEESQIGPFMLGCLFRDGVDVLSHALEFETGEVGLHALIGQVVHGITSTSSP